MYIVVQKPFPTCYLRLSPTIEPIWNYLKGAPRFWLYVPFFGTPPFMCYPSFTAHFWNNLKGAPKTRNRPFRRGHKVPQKIRASLNTPPPFHLHLGNTYLNRPHYHYGILWLYTVEFPATFTFHVNKCVILYLAQKYWYIKKILVWIHPNCSEICLDWSKLI